MRQKIHHITTICRLFLFTTGALVAMPLLSGRVAAACNALPTNRGTATFTVNVPSSGAYRFWAHVYSPSGGNDAFYMQVDQSYCQVTVGNTGISAGQFKWVDYQNGNANDKVNLSLSEGGHTFTVAGLDPSVGVDKILLASDANCIPTGDGTNCANTTSPASVNQNGSGSPNGGTQDPGKVSVSSGTRDDATPLRNPIVWAALIIVVFTVATVLIRQLKPAWFWKGKEWIVGKVLHRRLVRPQPLSGDAIVYTSNNSRKHHWWDGLFLLGLAVIGISPLIPNVVSANGVGYHVWNATVAHGASIVNKADAIGGKMLQFAAGATTTAPGTGGGGQGPAPAPSASSLNLPRIPWEGGPGYWAQFSKANAGGWTHPSFFPISVFLGKPDSPSHVSSLKDAGINLYMGVEHNPPLSAVTNQGIFVMPQMGEWTQAEVGNNSKAVAWFISDECDQGEGSCWLNGSTAARVTQQQSWVNEVRAYNDGRFAHANYGNGILRTYWAPGDDMNKFIQMVDSASADKYTYTSPGVAAIIDGGHDAPDWPNGTPVARAYSYGWQADQMRRFQDPARLRPVWTFIETAMPFLNESGARTIAPDQIEGAVWSALIHEARGIAYFQHNNNGQCGTYSIVECPNVHTKVKAINAKVLSLAPVLNTQSYYNKTRVVNGFTYYYYSFDNGTDTMLKTYNGSAYIFAGIGMGHGTGSKTFTLPPGVNGTTVTVVGEGRTIPVSNRAFTDNFANEYTHHVYQIQM